MYHHIRHFKKNEFNSSFENKCMQRQNGALQYYVGIPGESEFENHSESSQFETKSRDCQVLSSQALFVTLGVDLE